jgi:hypothetical protein
MRSVRESLRRKKAAGFYGANAPGWGKVWGVCHNDRAGKDAVIFGWEWGCVRIYFHFHKAYTGDKEKENTMYTILMLFVVRVILPVGVLLLIGGWLRRKQEGMS